MKKRAVFFFLAFALLLSPLSVGAQALRPFPQAGQDVGLVVELFPLPVSQEEANLQILRQFANLVDREGASPLGAARSELFAAAGRGGTGSLFLVDPVTWNDPQGFRMVLTLDAGTGGTAQTETSYRVTVCESMGYGMLMLVLLAGSEDVVLGGDFGERTMRQVLWAGLPEALRLYFSYDPAAENAVSFQTYFDAMFRSLRFWPTHPVHAVNGHHSWGADVTVNAYRGGVPPVGFRPSYQMAWSIHHVWQGDERTQSQITSRVTPEGSSPGHFQRETGPSTATDGTMDMAYALILAHEQWGGDAWCPQHRYDRAPGYTYLEWARRMVQEIFDVTVHHSGHIGTANTATINAGYFLKIGNWANSNSASGRLSRPSDHMMQHLKAFAEINPERDWQRVINVTYDSHRFIRQYDPSWPATGILPDFIRFDHENSNPQPDGTGNVWLIPAQHTGAGSFHETSSDGAMHWNACRVPWRLGVDLMFSGHTPHPYSDITITAINHWHAAQNNNTFASVRGRWLDGSPNGSHGQNSNAFTGPMMVVASVLGPDDWFANGWRTATPARPGGFNFYGDYINILAMIASSGNEWTPVGSALTVENGVTANGFSHLQRVVAGARVPLRVVGMDTFGGWEVGAGVEFWPGFGAYDPQTYIIMPLNMEVFAYATQGSIPVDAPAGAGETADIAEESAPPDDYTYTPRDPYATPRPTPRPPATDNERTAPPLSLGWGMFFILPSAAALAIAGGYYLIRTVYRRARQSSDE